PVDRRSDGVEWSGPDLPGKAGGGAELAAPGGLRGDWGGGGRGGAGGGGAPTQALPAAGEVRIELDLRPATTLERAQVTPRARVVREIEAKFEAGAEKLVPGFTPTAPT